MTVSDELSTKQWIAMHCNAITDAWYVWTPLLWLLHFLHLTYRTGCAHTSSGWQQRQQWLSVTKWQVMAATAQAWPPLDLRHRQSSHTQSTVDMDPPRLEIAEEVSFFMQSGLIKDTVKVDMSELTLKTLKDCACNFIDRKVCLLSLLLN